jgi:uncharacterized protein (DUF2141 family)
MKLLVLLVASLLSTTDGGIAPGLDLELEITGVRSDKGHVLIAVYREGDGFTETKSSAFRKEVIPATVGTMKVEVKDLPAGTYALAFIHDENDNLKVDTGFLGIPVEGFCFSRNAMGLFGPPSFKDAAITHVAGGAVQKVTLKY